MMDGVEMFNHEQLFASALMISEPLYVKNVDFDPAVGELHIHIDFRKGSKFKCPICGDSGLKVHDTIEKTWRHLNFFQYKAFLHFRTPRIDCPKDGVHLTHVPWASPESGFTMLFEALVLQLAQCMPMGRIAELMDEHDTRLWRVLKRHVDAAREEADYSEIQSVGIDETSSKRRHTYVSLFVDMEKSQVVHVAEGKDSETLKSFKDMLIKREIKPTQVQKICADMSPAFRKGVQNQFPWADLTFDKFHVIKLMNEALDKVRRLEQKNQIVLKNSRYLWLYNPNNLNQSQSEKLAGLSSMHLKTARAYRIKLALQDIYSNASDKTTAMILLKDWHSWASRSRLTPITEFARTVKNNWAGILNYFDSKLTNGILEGMNSIVQSARNRARGYRNVNNFITMIFLLGGKLKLGIHLT